MFSTEVLKKSFDKEVKSVFKNGTKTVLDTLNDCLYNRGLVSFMAVVLDPRLK